LFRRECERAVLERVPVQFEEMFGERDQWLEVRVFPTEEGVSLFCRDITARRRQEQVQRVNSIGMLAGGMAHDFNNLLTPVALSIGLLQGRLPDAESRATLDAMAACTRRGAEMVNRMLSLSRGAGGRRVAVSVSDLMDDITGIARETFPRGIRVEVSGAGASGWVTGDPAQLRQVVLNLCLNARDAMPEGGVLTVSAVVETLDKRAAAACLDGTPGRFLRLGVRDTGVGMDDATRARLFEPFFTTKGGGNGSGLGLATALGIVKSHGGFFRVDSQPGVGSLFEVFLPASPAPEARPAQEVLPQGVTRGHDELVLVVDDEPAIREITRQTLELSGYRVEVAADGVEGLARFVERRGEVAAVVTDLMMPQMDGHALMRALRNLHPTVPIVATSGVSRRAQDAGCSGVRFLAKPFTAETLTAALHAALTERNTVTQGTR
jgi:signal transduction histidine kinase/ActR/RegA family two-component response regulator